MDMLDILKDNYICTLKFVSIANLKYIK
jgi:hypothetical protein